MDPILIYIFIGSILSFLLDHFTIKYADVLSWKDIPDWGWSSRIIFILLWPIGVIIFIVLFIDNFINYN
jgi:hypothetical protein